MPVIIDRFEGTYAVLETEDRLVKRIKRDEIPAGAREGDILVVVDDKWNIDQEATMQRKKKIAALADELWEK